MINSHMAVAMIGIYPTGKQHHYWRRELRRAMKREGLT